MRSTLSLFFLSALSYLTIHGQDLSVNYVHPTIGRVTFVVPKILRGDYEHNLAEPSQSEVHDSYTIYACALPKRLFSDDHPVEFRISLVPERGVTSFEDLVDKDREWVSAHSSKNEFVNNLERNGVVDNLRCVCIAGQNWVRIDQTTPESPKKTSGVDFETFVKPGRALIIRLGATEVGKRGIVDRKLIEPYLKALEILMPTVRLELTVQH